MTISLNIKTKSLKGKTAMAVEICMHAQWTIKAKNVKKVLLGYKAKQLSHN